MAGTAKKTVSKAEEVSVKRPKVQRGWYVLRAISGKEAKVKEILDAQIKNTDLGKHLFQVLIPTEKVLTVRSGKKVVKERNLYSGYVFVEAELTGETMATLTNTSNVIDFLRGRDRSSAPECLREAEVRRMLGVIDDFSGNPDEGVNDYIVGETVKVIDGPFNGFSAIIESVNSEKKKITVAVKIFGRKTPLTLDNSQVERE